MSVNFKVIGAVLKESPLNTAPCPQRRLGLVGICKKGLFQHSPYRGKKAVIDCVEGAT